jgi:hypothetical protein
LVNEDDILAFVRDVIRSVWTLDLLLLLQRNSIVTWPVPDLVTALHANARIVTESLAALRVAGLAEVNEAGLHHYCPASTQLADTVAALAAMYTHKPVAVVRAIFSAPNDKIQTFADAFRFKK